ncbi:gliding motility-associated C-terminal domain-containing protein [Pontibacter harenae]|uniref:gliding motility-associated C-terminal domain-containing protein n=1 Tax=Pontibacter harenae TaxID=2894083 RepID=UPI001E645DD2|nr:gliding motility-associated C-terminal domain-containing protein [Pontibacter harenae]MCC9166095.1 gliding motility-associated C-terminal domain-containing protein [Pontibacter harenae]
MKTRILLLFIFLAFSFQSFATHLVGGEFELKHLVDYNYRLSLNLYFDEINGSPNAKDNSIYVSIFEKGSNTRIQDFFIPLIRQERLNYTNIACTTNDLKTSRMLYYKDIFLDPAIFNSPQGYYVVWERCCRNNTAINIVEPGAAGQTFYMEFPAVIKNNTPFVNSTPNLSPPITDYACQGELFYYNFKTLDTDGDSLVYDLTTPINGYSTETLVNPVASPAPYPTVRWLSGYNQENQIAGEPGLNINRTTGMLTVRPTNKGLYVFAVRTQEFRKGVKIGEVRREFQLLVKECPSNYRPVILAKTKNTPGNYYVGEVIRIKQADPRCITITYTDADRAEPLKFTAKPVNFTETYFTVSGQSSGIVNNGPGTDSLRASLCFDNCFDTQGKVYYMDLIASDNGDDGCGLPQQDSVRIGFMIEPVPDKPPHMSLSTARRVFEVEVGDLLQFDVFGADPDNDSIFVSARGLNFDLNTQQISFPIQRGVGQVKSSFNWLVDCNALQQPSFKIDLLVTTVTCDDSTTVSQTVEVKVKSEKIASNAISSEQIICMGAPATKLTGTQPTGGKGSFTYLWEVSTTNGQNGFTAAPGINNQKEYTPTSVSNTSWFRRKAIASNCSNNFHFSDPVKVTVLPIITNNKVGSDQVVCLNAAPALLKGEQPVGGSNQYTYTWEYSTDNLTYKPAPGLNNKQDYQPERMSATTWYRRKTFSSPCMVSESNIVKVTVNLPLANNTISSPQIICRGERPATLNGSVPTGGNGIYAYLWESSTTSAIAGFSPAAGNNTAATYTAGPLDRTTWFRRTVISAPCQQHESVAAKVVVEAVPDPPKALNVLTCPGQPASLVATAFPTDATVEWYDQPSGGNLIHRGTTLETNPLATTTDFYAQVVNKLGCASSSRAKVTASVEQTSANAGEDALILLGNQYKLTATGGVSYHWAPEASLSDPTIPNPVAKPKETTTYTVTVVTEAGCSFTDEVTITVLQRIVSPNAITPNHDHINDVWEIKNIEQYPNCTVKIFTRWGASIFESKGYKEPWNGLHNGKELPVAAYYYMIDLGIDEKPISGTVLIIR